jgi:hypothetical protein
MNLVPMVQYKTTYKEPTRDCCSNSIDLAHKESGRQPDGSTLTCRWCKEPILIVTYHE